MKKENFIVIVFKDQGEAINASHKLQDLTVRGDINLGYNMILRKNSDGKIEVLKKTTTDGIETWGGMLIGMLIGMFFGPLGFLISSLAGTAVGAATDSSNKKFNENFSSLVKEKLDEGKIAIIANIDEQSPAFIDEAMKEFNGEVHRTEFSK